MHIKSEYSKIGDITEEHYRDKESKSSLLSPRRLEEKLWGGHSISAMNDLHEMISSRNTSHKITIEARWVLANWYAVHNDFKRAINSINNHLPSRPGNRTLLRRILLASYCYVREGDLITARDLVTEALKIHSRNPNLFLSMANSYSSVPNVQINIKDDNNRLVWINKVYENSCVNKISKINSNLPLSIDNIKSLFGNDYEDSHIKVSVIVPAFNSGAGLSIAIESLLQQTWSNLEIIIVDDCSEDKTFQMAKRYSLLDSRVIVVKQNRNYGTYVARNTGLNIASGDIITIHDSNDWSHPQKIQLQVQHLLKNNCVANFSNMCRIDNDFIFVGKYRHKFKLIDWNPSSFMFKKEILVKIGYWDNVRISADAEFVGRVEKLFPGKVLGLPENSPPLSFVLDEPNSLTSNSVTHGRTVSYGIRSEYRDAARYWRVHCSEKELKLDNNLSIRKFPVPGMMLPNRKVELESDLLIIADFNFNTDILERSLEHIHSAIEKGYQVSVFQWRHYLLNVKDPLCAPIRNLASNNIIKILSPGENITVEEVIIMSPVILQHLIDLPPKIKTRKLSLLLDALPSNNVYDPLDYDYQNVRKSLNALFGETGVWYATSNYVYQNLDKPIKELSERIWFPFVANDYTEKIHTSIKCNIDEEPRLVRIASDDISNWPATYSELKRAFCVGEKCSVDIYGGIKFAPIRYNKIPANWKIISSHSDIVEVNYSGYNFLLHYPNKNNLELTCQMAILKAMSVGCVVIMLPDLESVYQDCVIYSTHNKVWGTIKEIWSDKKLYRKLSIDAINYVNSNFSQDSFINHLGKLN